MRFKDDIVETRFKDLHPTLQEIATDAASWFLKAYGVELMITATVSTAEEDKKLKRVSDTHRTRRAIDIRTNGLEEEEIGELVIYMTRKWGKHGAVVSSVPQLVVNKSHGTGPHLHIQLNRKFALKELTYGQKA